ncbi:MAG: hypothetical protein HUJ54_14055 [Erysipelotrichaceae bacterium]|nr:hypothetical protein [Erysipelotrichaceae bacterium]
MKKTYFAGIILAVLIALTGWVSVFNPDYPSRQVGADAKSTGTVFEAEGIQNVFFELYAQDAQGKRTCLNDTLKISYTPLNSEGVSDTLLYPNGRFTVKADLPKGTDIKDLCFAIQAQPCGNSEMVQVFSQEGYIQLKRYLMAFGVEYPSPVNGILNQNMSQTGSGLHADFPTRKQSDDSVSENQNGRYFLIGFNKEGKPDSIYIVDFFVTESETASPELQTGQQ